MTPSPTFKPSLCVRRVSRGQFPPCLLPLLLFLQRLRNMVGEGEYWTHGNGLSSSTSLSGWCGISWQPGYYFLHSFKVVALNSISCFRIFVAFTKSYFLPKLCITFLPALQNSECIDSSLTLKNRRKYHVHVPLALTRGKTKKGEEK